MSVVPSCVLERVLSYFHVQNKYEIRDSVYCRVPTKNLINLKVRKLLLLEYIECTFWSHNRLKHFLKHFWSTRALVYILRYLGYMTLVPSQKVDKKLTFPSQQNNRKYTSMVIQRKKA